MPRKSSKKKIKAPFRPIVSRLKLSYTAAKKWRKVIEPLITPASLMAMKANLLPQEMYLDLLMGSGPQMKRAVWPLEVINSLHGRGPYKSPDPDFFKQPMRPRGSAWNINHFGGPVITTDLKNAWWFIHGDNLPMVSNPRKGQQCPKFKGKLRCRRHVEKTIRVFKTCSGNWCLRCHLCGTLMEIPHLVQEYLAAPIENCVTWMIENQLFKTPPPDKWIKHFKACQFFMEQFNLHRYIHEDWVLSGKIPAAFGEWAVMDCKTVNAILEAFGWDTSDINSQKFQIRLERNLFGRPVGAHILGLEDYSVGRIILCSGDKSSVFAASGSLYRDWTDGTLMCLNETTAWKAQVMMEAWPPERRLPVIWLNYLGSLLSSNKYFDRLLVLVEPGQTIPLTLNNLGIPDLQIRETPDNLSSLTADEFYGTYQSN